MPNNFTSFYLDADTSATINITESDNSPDVNIKIIGGKESDFSIDKQYIDSGLHISARKEKSEHNFSILSDVKDAIKKDSLSSLFSTITKAITHADHSNSEVVIDLRVPKNFTTIDIRGNNLNVNINHCLLNAVDIKSNNLDFKSLSDLQINLLRINSSNSDIDLVASNGMKNVKIDASNCDLIIRKKSSFKGKVDIKGNNVDVEGDTNGNPSEGVINCRASNCDVKIISV